jgi:hypothetical protein
MEQLSQWMSGADFNAQQTSSGDGSGMGQAITTVTDGAVLIFGQIGANRYILPSRFKPDDVVIPEPLRDNRAYITAGIAAVLLVAVAAVIYFRA